VEFLQTIVSQSEIPILTAFVLGLMTAISPCPLATNITAIGFISKDIQQKRRVFTNGLLYTLGRAVSYTVLGVILIVLFQQGVSLFKVQRFVSLYGMYLLVPLLMVMGVFMLDIIKVSLPGVSSLTTKMEEKASSGSAWSSFLMGVVFALAFCPYSGVLFFGALIPLSVSVSAGYALPFVFAIATGLPVVLFAWVFAFSLSSVSLFYTKMKVFEKWFRRVVGVVFISVSLYFATILFF
jgi:cytochrome c-type biogenesis protein